VKEITVRDVERTSIIVLIVGSTILVLLARDERVLVSFALGSSLVIVNLRALKWIVEGALKRERKKMWFLLFLPLQFLLLLGFVTILLFYGSVRAVPFLLGISTLFLSILIAYLTPLRSNTDGA
jgi:hypothetical protein